jgi:hypothetical protein
VEFSPCDYSKVVEMADYAYNYDKKMKSGVVYVGRFEGNRIVKPKRSTHHKK